MNGLRQNQASNRTKQHVACLQLATRRQVPSSPSSTVPGFVDSWHDISVPAQVQYGGCEPCVVPRLTCKRAELQQPRGGQDYSRLPGHGSPWSEVTRCEHGRRGRHGRRRDSSTWSTSSRSSRLVKIDGKFWTGTQVVGPRRRCVCGCVVGGSAKEGPCRGGC